MLDVKVTKIMNVVEREVALTVSLAQDDVIIITTVH